MQKTIHILLAGVDSVEAEAIGRELSDAGVAHQLRRALAGEEFLTALKDFRPEVILAADQAADAEGKELWEPAKRLCPEIPVIVMAEAAEKGRAVEVIKQGAADCVFKARGSQLAPAVARAVREAEERAQRRRAEVLLEVKCQQLSLQNEVLRESEIRFRQLAESIHEVFWMTDVEKTQMLYISPAYEEVWGRTCASLLAAPLDWLASLHPDDRDRVVDAVFHKQAAGEYDEQFRIVRPDGTRRWIHDRAFCVRDETGTVYRLAGIAEDVTVRRQLEKQVLEISDREQERMGRELHDSLCQLLVSVGFNASALKKDLEQSAAREAAAADRIGQKVGAAIKLARNLSHGLCLVNSIGDNLGAALNELAQNTTADYGILCEADCGVGDGLAAGDVAAQVYRIAQEAVHNAVKHARPTRIFIRLAAEAGRAVLSVTDDGCGMVNAAERRRSGLGLEIMKYRAGVIFGSLEIGPAELAAGRGTKVACYFPFKLGAGRQEPAATEWPSGAARSPGDSFGSY
jgi:PAS domain S-box-containing protein